MIMPDNRSNPRKMVLIVLVVLGLVEAGMLFYAARQSRNTRPKVQQGQLADQWSGKWIGPEGTFLEILKDGARYKVMIQSLDGSRTFQGVPVPTGIEFQRNGKTEIIRAGNGQDTGMKWLLDKKNCLVIRSGEGFCRD